MHGNLLGLQVRAVRLRRSFTQDGVIVSDPFRHAFCWNVSEVNNSITECLIECFDRILVLSPNSFA